MAITFTTRTQLRDMFGAPKPDVRAATRPERRTQPLVVATPDGWLYDGNSYASRADAFRAVEASEWFADGVRSKRPESFDLAAPRWLDAAAEEPEAAVQDGGWVTPQGIDEMVTTLTLEAKALPIDGGNVSAVHESVWNSAAPAAGWVFGGVHVVDAEQRSHLWLYVGLLPDVDAQVDAKQLLYGSIAFFTDSRDRYTDEPIGMQLISYALTNTPFIAGLEPHAARSTPAGAQRFGVTRSHKVDTMTTENTNEAPTQRALEAFESEAAAETWVNEILSVMRDASGDAELGPADALALLQASRDHLGSAFEGAPDAADAERDAPEGDSEAEERSEDATPEVSDPNGEPDAEATAEPEAEEGAEEAAERAQRIATEAQLRTVTAERDALRLQVRQAEAAESVDAMIAERGLIVSAEQRSTLIDIAAKHGDEIVRASLDASNAPPSGVATDPQPGETTNFPTGKDATDHHAKTVRTEHPEWSEQAVIREAQNRAYRASPELFTTSSADAGE